MIAVVLLPVIFALVFLVDRLIKKGWPEKLLYLAVWLIVTAVVILDFVCLP